MISFIVPAHNEAQHLASTLTALHAAAQSLGCGYEIIVVDDASTDATADIARHCGARVETVAFRHIAATRNAGARVARFTRLIFVDADTRITPEVFVAAMSALEAGATGGGAAVQLEGESRMGVRLLTVLMMHIFRWTHIAPGCFLYCQRADFDAVGGFDESLFAAEDVALSRALARRGRFVILRESVFTSNRKINTRAGLRAHLRLFLSFVRLGPRVLQSREHLGLWYDNAARGEDTKKH